MRLILQRFQQSTTLFLWIAIISVSVLEDKPTHPPVLIPTKLMLYIPPHHYQTTNGLANIGPGMQEFTVTRSVVGQLLKILRNHWFLNTNHWAILGSQVYWILALRKDSVDMMHQVLKHHNIKKSFLRMFKRFIAIWDFIM